MFQISQWHVELELFLLFTNWTTSIWPWKKSVVMIHFQVIWAHPLNTYMIIYLDKGNAKLDDHSSSPQKNVCVFFKNSPNVDPTRDFPWDFCSRPKKQRLCNLNPSFWDIASSTLASSQTTKGSFPGIRWSQAGSGWDWNICYIYMCVIRMYIYVNLNVCTCIFVYM